ncbi:helix-turn-helix domain-containing protein [Bradyrhizobium cenepequi]|uniref:helix-turn-helix domain-containing protein n=1 Tax=Bradyrhizobium cenepequi TaxID=2821403 RepID=UPI001CE2EE38|nr:AraC family transcriptional regulator [Bradyrhizobium cenepequi]MCA6106773.1 helix-turn-helix transcriptional regulator [Bradyrhizobium cenepequi]
MSAAELLDKRLATAVQQSSEQAARPDSTVIGVDLKHLGVSVRVVPANGRHTANAGAPETERALHIAEVGRDVEVSLSFDGLVSRAIRDMSKARMEQDPVVRRLSEALAAAERDQSEFGGIYADAIRLVTVARMISADTTPASPVQASRDGGLSKWRLKRVVEYVAEHLDEKVTLADMAAAARLSRMHFAALFFRATGLTPHQYLLKQRVSTAQEMLRTTDKSIVDIALSVGFSTQAHFTTVFKRIVGQTPLKWREGRSAEPRLPSYRRFGADERTAEGPQLV